MFYSCFTCRCVRVTDHSGVTIDEVFEHTHRVSLWEPRWSWICEMHQAVQALVREQPGFSSSIHITDFFGQPRPFSGFCRLAYSFLTTQMCTPTVRPQTQNPAFITDIQEKCREIDAPKKKNGHGDRKIGFCMSRRKVKKGSE